ncbi:uncharacterized protein LOC142327388 [Lycorma delicatula]|uniref:uncharacterized protein LOC142327388 n=1 Tax=Lycorma delicatula TaxID=130591 RepID=UPI003F519C9F
MIATEIEADLVITTEPNRNVAARHDWIEDTKGDVAIKNCSNRHAWQLHRRDEGILSIILTEFFLVTGYVSPNIDLEDYETYIGKLMSITMQAPKRVILMGDFNCKAIIAGSDY